MTTRLELRDNIRRRLEDTGATPLWDDATLNEFLDDAIQHYGVRFPADRSVSVAVSDGATSVPVAAIQESAQIVRVLDGAGVLVPRIASETDDGIPAPGQAWRWWAGNLVLASPATAGTWQIDYRGQRTLPVSDGDAIDIVAGDEEILAVLAAAMALRRRAIEDAKRGITRDRTGIAQDADPLYREAEERMQARRKQARGGYLG